jgi:MSHA biogenesis protein MshK
MAAALRSVIVAVAILPQASLAEDPTRPPPQLLEAQRPPAGAAAASAGDLHLQAVLRTAGRPPGAMINGWVLRPGDTVHGVKLATVGEQHADVIVGGERVRLSLTPGIRRQPVADHAASATAPARPAGKAPAPTKKNATRGEPR